MNQSIKSITLLCTLFFLLPLASFSQCATPISTFPYSEGFELNNGGWTSGGTVASDWAWGTPNKPVITGAATGTKCWIAGGLTASSYNNGERSWLQSPCFNFSSLTYPYISFKVFWETENVYDGASLQYSTNNGATWNTVGAYNEPANCMNAIWYNQASITNLTGLATNKAGWSGNKQTTQGSCQGGAGSTTWLLAKHCLDNLAGQSAVIFRFVFGAGTTCNAYDGFAVDDIFIGNAPATNATFTYQCQGNAMLFSNAGGSCNSSYAWNFGDPASGANNTSSVTNPTHTFSAPGTYTVTLQVSGPCNPTATYSKTITILNVQAQIVQALNCSATNGSVTAVVTGVSANTPPFTYSWNTTPVQNTPTINNLGPGQYTVSISGADICPTSSTVTLTSPTQFQKTTTSTPTNCSVATGTASVLVTGGTPPYTYQWSPSGGTTATATGLASGIYTVTIHDANGCADTAQVSVGNLGNFKPNLGKDTTLCKNAILVYNLPNYSSYLWQDGSTLSSFLVSVPGTYWVQIKNSMGCVGRDTVLVNYSNLSTSYTTQPSDCYTATGAAQVLVSGARAPITYIWQPSVSSTASAIAIASGNYTVQLKDANQCDASVQLYVPNLQNLSVSLGVDTILCPEKTYTLNPGNFQTYLWSTGEQTPSIVVNQSNFYSVTVSNFLGCTASDTVGVLFDCQYDIFFPNGFTPNGDGNNDHFGAMGNLSFLDYYDLSIYNRWGERMFHTRNANDKWNGTYKDVPQELGTYNWICTYQIINKKQQVKKGDATLLR
jgi:gliding motility-associated-like protein